MITAITHFPVYVRSLDAAKQWYTEDLGLMVREDDTTGQYRWLTLSPPYVDSPEIVLKQADDFYFGNRPRDMAVILQTDNACAECERLKRHGVKMIDQEPQKMPWGLCMMISDPDDNLIQIIEPTD